MQVSTAGSIPERVRVVAELVRSGRDRAVIIDTLPDPPSAPAASNTHTRASLQISGVVDSDVGGGSDPYLVFFTNPPVSC